MNLRTCNRPTLFTTGNMDDNLFDLLATLGDDDDDPTPTPPPPDVDDTEILQLIDEDISWDSIEE